MSMPVTDATSLTLSALSLHVPDADWFVPSPLFVMGASQLAMPDRLSFPLKVTVTSVLFQPNALGGTSRAALAVGLVLSMLMLLTVDGSAALPATSTQLPVLVTVWLAPSVLTVAPATVLVATPDCTAPASAQLKPTVTSTLFQPKAFGAGLRLPVITGFVLSIFTVTLPTALHVAAFVRASPAGIVAAGLRGKAAGRCATVNSALHSPPAVLVERDGYIRIVPARDI